MNANWDANLAELIEALKPFVRNGLLELGWDVPVLEGYSCAIELAKSMVNLDIEASSLMFPPDHPSKWRRKKVF